MSRGIHRLTESAVRGATLLKSLKNFPTARGCTFSLNALARSTGVWPVALLASRELRRLRKTTQQESSVNSFSAVALEWFAKQKPAWAETRCTKVKWMLEKNLFPWMGSPRIAQITPPELLMTLRRIEGPGAIETAKRVKQVAGQVFRFAIASGRAQRDPSQDLRGALTAPVKRHLAAITDPKDHCYSPWMVIAAAMSFAVRCGSHH
jgi:hypothetical protein